MPPTVHLNAPNSDSSQNRSEWKCAFICTCFADFWESGLQIVPHLDGNSTYDVLQKTSLMAVFLF